MSQFSHLHFHSQASLLDAISRPNESFERVAEIGQNSLSLTDHGVMYGVAEFLKASKKHGIKLIGGNEFYIAARGIKDKTARDAYHLTVLCDGSKQGWKNICNLHWLSFAEGFYYNNRIDLDSLAAHNKGLIALSGCAGGAVLKPFIAGDLGLAEQRIKDLKAIFGAERFFIELQHHDLPFDDDAVVWLRKMAIKHKLKTVVTNDAHYARIEDSYAHDVMIAIGTGTCIGDANRQKEYAPEKFYLKDYDEMKALGFTASELKQSQVIADMIEPLKLDSKVFHIPKLFDDSSAVLESRVKEDIKKRYPVLTSEIKKRARYELDAITKAGFADYLLIVADIYDYMRREKIPFGPGRGSVCGSLVAYVLGMTEVDPLHYNLPFERFINTERVSMPDVDMDISALKRDQVIQYVKEKYGTDNAGGIITFNSMGARAAIRDIGKAFRLPDGTKDLLAKAVPMEGSQTKDRESRGYLELALNQKVIRQAYDADQRVKEVIDVGMRLEGVMKSASKHAAGVVISDVPLRNLVPMGVKTKGDDPDPTVVGVEMNFVEDMGLIKYDFLGLRNVDVVDDCIKDMIAHKAVKKDFDPTQIPLDDAATFEMLSRGLTEGLFQVESSGMKGWLRALKPDKVEDIMAMVALYRPGPMEQIKHYVGRKHGKEPITYPHESLEPILKETYGIPIFQEQLMFIGQAIAGWSLARADQLRKTLGKKIVDDIGKEKIDFVKGGMKQGHDQEWLTDLFETFIEPAAKYLFNKSHACAYGLLSYQTAYLKCNYPTFYFAALLKSIEDHPKREEKMAAYIADARELGVAILPPDINVSDFSFTAIPVERSVRFGMNGVKNVGSKAVLEIIKERKNGPFTEFFSTVERIKSTLVNSRCIESLVLSGGFDSIPGSRAAKASSLDVAFTRADAHKEDAKRVKAGGKPVKRKNPLPDAVLAEAADDELEMLSKERELIGYYLSNHPYLAVASSIHASHTIQSSREEESGTVVSVGGIVSRLTEHTTKKGKQKMFFGAIEDDKAVLEFVIFPRQYDDAKAIIKLDRPVVLHGKIENSGDDDGESSSSKLIVNKVESVGIGIKKLKGTKLEKHIVLGTNYRKQLSDLRAEMNKVKENDCCNVKIELPNGKVVKVIK